MKITIDVKKSVQENAAFYYERAKKARKKIDGAKLAYGKTLEKIKNYEERGKIEVKKAKREKEWYEKFRWSFTSEGKLMIGGRDTTTNDIVVKKHADKGDLVLHTEAPGSPFVIIKSEGKEISKKEIDEAAQFCAANSRAWRDKVGIAEVMVAKPEQLKKSHGVKKGTFVVEGKRQLLKSIVGIYIGVMEDGKILSGVEDVVKKLCKVYFLLKPGNEKKSDTAKKLKYEFKVKGKVDVDLNDIISSMPPRECKIVKK
jgi:predicted ribosome quality control (RQC) complex YloA/Tae2 family protein